jgi:trimethylamine--corrinoid protein Co-methyltransferase
VQEVAEVLAGLAYVNAIRPGAPAIFGLWPFVSDLRSGAMSGGSPEQALLSSACGQMAHFYDLTGGTSSGISDSKVPDSQSGSEKGYNHALVGNAGANLIYEAAGMHGSLLGFCLEGVVLDNDVIGACQRTIRGIDVTDETLSLDTIRAAVLGGPGHYLGSPQTLELMQTEYIYPAIGDRLSPKEWNEVGRPQIVPRATAKVNEVLAHHYPDHIPDDVDARVRAHGPVRFDREKMKRPPA